MRSIGVQKIDYHRRFLYTKDSIVVSNNIIIIESFVVYFFLITILYTIQCEHGFIVNMYNNNNNINFI